MVFGLAARGGLESDRLVLIGVGVAAAADALITVVIVLTDPWSIAQGADVAVRVDLRADAAAGRAGARSRCCWPCRCSGARTATLDLLAVDDDTPRLVGVRLDRARPLLLGLACLLTATAVSAVGVIAFVGLVAPHAARALVGARHARMLPVAALLGALLVSVADTLGRTVIAPEQLPAGLLTALVGTPYFVWLLWRSRSVDYGHFAEVGASSQKLSGLRGGGGLCEEAGRSAR